MSRSSSGLWPRYQLCGLARLYDPPRPDSHGLIDKLRSLGIHVLMLTGDALPVAAAIMPHENQPELLR